MIGVVRLWKWLIKKTEAYTVQVPYTTTENIIINVNPNGRGVGDHDELVANASPARSDVSINVVWSGYRSGSYGSTVAVTNQSTLVYCDNRGSNIGLAHVTTIHDWSVASGGTKINNTQIRCNATQTVTRYRTETRYREVSEWFHR